MGFFEDLLFGEEAEIEQIPLQTAEQQELFSALGQALTTQLGGAAAPTAAAQQTLVEALAGISPEVAEERFREAVLPRQQRLFREEVVPQIQRAFTQAGFTGTPEAKAISRAAGVFGEFEAAQLAQAIEQGRQGALQGLALAPGITQFPVQAGLAFTGQRTFENLLTPGTAGIAGPLAGAALGSFLGPAGFDIGGLFGGLGQSAARGAVSALTSPFSQIPSPARGG